MRTGWRGKVLVVLLLLGCVAAGIFIFLRSARFGALPENEHLARIQHSPHYADGMFHNLLPTEVLRDGRGFVSTLVQSFFIKKERSSPDMPVPTVKTPLKSLKRDLDTVIWLGHSSFFVQLGGQRILIDPVLSDYAAPVPFGTRAFPGSSTYTPDDIPEIDLLLISHDHWDHLDHPTLMALRPKIRRIYCGLGVGAHLQRWGFSRSIIHEGDWGEQITLKDLTVHITSARHFSGRSLVRNKTLWVGFVLETPQRRIFYSGDSGYGPHFAELGKRFGPLDLVLLECGQYDRRWNLIHMMPEETARAADDLRARVLLPAHSGKFSIAYHAWDEPYKRITAASRGRAWRLVTPMIGEALALESKQGAGEGEKRMVAWWQQIR